CDALARQRRRLARHSGAVGPRALVDDAGLYTRFDGEVDRRLRQGASQGVVLATDYTDNMDCSYSVYPCNPWLKCWKIVFAVLAFNDCLAGGVVACGGHGFETTLVNRLPATCTNPVTSFFDPQERLID